MSYCEEHFTSLNQIRIVFILDFHTFQILTTKDISQVISQPDSFFLLSLTLGYGSVSYPEQLWFKD